MWPMPTGEREELSPTGKWEMWPLKREKEISGERRSIVDWEEKETSSVLTGLPAAVSEAGERGVDWEMG